MQYLFYFATCFIGFISTCSAESPGLPVKRSALLGIMPNPHDWSIQSVLDTFKFVQDNSDLSVYQVNAGVPWVELETGTEPHPKVAETIEGVKKLVTHPMFVAVSPLNGPRDGVSDYWGATDNQPAPPEWKNREFDDPVLIETYLKFCRYVIAKLNPTYMAYVIEGNMIMDTAPEKFPKLLKLIKTVYKTLKRENPSLKLFVTIQIDYFHNNPNLHTKPIKQLLKYSDILAVSTYPNFDYGFGEPSKPELPRNWFSSVHDLAPRKPFAVAETAYPAENSVIQPQKLFIKGSPEEQSRYLSWLLDEVQRLHGVFVAWLTPRDVDRMAEYIQAHSEDDLLKFIIGFIKDTGLSDENGKARKSLKLWRKWLRIQRAK